MIYQYTLQKKKRKKSTKTKWIKYKEGLLAVMYVWGVCLCGVCVFARVSGEGSDQHHKVQETTSTTIKGVRTRKDCASLCLHAEYFSLCAIGGGGGPPTPQTSGCQPLLDGTEECGERPPKWLWNLLSESYFLLSNTSNICSNPAV